MARHVPRALAHASHNAGAFWERIVEKAGSAGAWMGGHKIATGAIAAGTVTTGYVATTAFRGRHQSQEMARRDATPSQGQGIE